MKKIAETQQQAEAITGEAALCALELELSRTKDKYEKRIAGLERKYLQDTETLKREVANFSASWQGTQDLSLCHSPQFR